MKATIQTNKFRAMILSLKNTMGRSDTPSPSLSYIRLDFEENKVTGYSTDGYMAARITENCFCKDAFSVFLKPFAIRKSTPKSYTEFELIDGRLLIETAGTITGFSQPNLEKHDLDSFFKPLRERKPTYGIAFNPGILISALKAMLEMHDSQYSLSSAPVILQFGSPSDPVLLRYRSKSVEVLALPVKYPRMETEENS